MTGYAISIDPGKNIGWALWDVSRWDDLVFPVEYGAICPNPKLEWLDQVHYSMEKFHEQVIDRFGISLSDAYVEMPRLMESAGMVAARSGALVKLVLATGAIIDAMWTNDTAVHEVPVNWKGQLDKRMMAHRIESRYMPILGKTIAAGNHAMDAVGIGLWAKGFFVLEGVYET